MNMAAQAVIVASHLSKFYGKSLGIEDLSFEVMPGEVFGFLGPNGAGKTTTIRTLLDFIRPTGGSVRVFGLDPRADGVKLRARVGYLPGELALYERLTGARYLADFAALREGAGRDRIDELAERVGLDLSKQIHELSHGNKQKVGLVQAFMHRPDLLILDEPTQGLDPLVQQTFYSILEEERRRGASVFLSSHVMPEVQRVCDRVGIIREGHLVTVADVGELMSRYMRTLELHFDGPAPTAAFQGLAGVSKVVSHGESLSLSIEGPVDAVIKEAAKHTVVNIETHEPSLEDVFLAYFGEEEK
jgi:ABC-2 type transport system ATP-binding protein